MSVLFADLVGFTSLSQQRDAEDVRELLGRYFDTARTVITRYGGTVEKFIGDAVMAAWGVQAIQENDAERAVRAALELVDAVAAFGEQVGAPGLRARAGVLTGEAAVTLDAAAEGMVAGDLVNTASRVQSVAEPGSVLVGDSTRSASEAAIEYEDAGSHQLKGKPEPVRLWRAARVIAGAGGSLRPTGLEPPFVGRDRELRLLKEFLHATTLEGKARLLSVVGLAGVGKSRLAWEFFKYTDGLSETVWYQRGRCLAYGEGVAFAALTEMVRMRVGIVENEPPDSAKRKLRAERRGSSSTTRRSVPGWSLAWPIFSGWRIALSVIARDLYAAWRVYFERHGGAAHGTARVRGPAVGGQRAPRLHRVPAGVVAQLPDPGGHPGAPEFGETRARLGHRQTRPHLALPRATVHRGDGTAAERHGAGAARGPARADPRPRRRASRCTPSRRCACSSTAGSWSRTTACIARRDRWRRWRCRRACTR